MAILRDHGTNRTGLGSCAEKIWRIHLIDLLWKLLRTELSVPINHITVDEDAPPERSSHFRAFRLDRWTRSSRWRRWDSEHNEA